MFLWTDYQREQSANFKNTFRTPGHPMGGHLPVVTRFAGRTWVLDDDAQSLIFTVSNRYTFRHDVGARAYARYVLLLAGKLGTDPTTAGSLARWMCPDGCVVARTGARVLHRMTRDEETRWRSARLSREHDARVAALAATAPAHVAEHGRNPDGPYTCAGCGSRRLQGNGGDNVAKLTTPGGVRRSCGPRCPGRTR
jgi:hypothetical protein